jgi:hypothetical protein
VFFSIIDSENYEYVDSIIYLGVKAPLLVHSPHLAVSEKNSRVGKKEVEMSVGGAKLITHVLTVILSP